ncbi:MAG TPA: hypothetical protein VMM55_11680 [Thermohalobaculum sp.]|nr:hypothetical protein [Thermohalobaculum sp.]
MPEEEVFILLVEVGRREGDGLPDDATGAAFLCYAAGRDEKNAVDETVAVLRQAGLSPLEVESYGTGSDPDGIEIGEEERALIARARAENAVIVASVEHFTEETS